MWTRQELKHKGKSAFLKAYWKFVLVTLVLGMVAGGSASIGSSFGSSVSNIGNVVGNRVSSENSDHDMDDDMDDEDEFDASGNGGLKEDIEDALNHIDPEAGTIVIDGKTVDIEKPAVAAIGAAVVIVILIVSLICLFVGIIGIAIDIFVYNPIEYGCIKFFRKSQHENTSLGTMFHGFKDGYGKIVKVLFFRDLFIFLWSLLFVIPGIVKSYEYRMVPFLLSENPNMTKDEALKASSRMMKGNKWRAFVLDLSFLGWHILSAFTFGMLEIFYVAPYVNGTNAALYEALKAEQNETIVTEG